MSFTVRIDTDNAAFEEGPIGPGPNGELARILHHLAEKVEETNLLSDQAAGILDINGNTVGRWEFRK